MTTVPNVTPDDVRKALRDRKYEVAEDGLTAQCPTHDYFHGDELALRIGAEDRPEDVVLECSWGCPAEGIVDMLGLGVVAADLVERPDPYIWPPLEPFDSEAPPLPLDGLPTPLRDLVVEGAEALQVPTDLVLNHALGMLSSAPYGTVEIKVKPGWTVPTQLATLSLAGSGEKKSPTSKIVNGPFREIEDNRIRRDIMDQQAREARIETENMRIEMLKGAAAKEAKSGNQVSWDEIEKARRRVSDLEGKHLKWASMMDDATPEYVGVQLGSTYTGAAVMVSDETSIFAHIAGNGKGVTGTEKAKVYLQGISGDPILTGRLGRAGESAPRPALSLALMLQPELFEKIVRSTPELVTSGIVPRMLIVKPRSRVGKRMSRTTPISERTLQDWAKAVKQIAGAAEEYVNAHLAEREKQLEENPDEIIPLRQVEPRIMEISLEGAEIIARYQDRVEAQLAKGGRFEHIASWVSKSATYVAQIAAILTLVDEPFAVDVKDEYLRVAERLIHTYAEHQLTLAEEPTESAAEQVWIRLRDYCADVQAGKTPPKGSPRMDAEGWITARDIRRLVQQQSWIKNADSKSRQGLLVEVLETLESRGYLRIAPGARKDSIKIQLRPA